MRMIADGVKLNKSWKFGPTRVLVLYAGFPSGVL